MGSVIAFPRQQRRRSGVAIVKNGSVIHLPARARADIVSPPVDVTHPIADCDAYLGVYDMAQELAAIARLDRAWDL